VADLVGGRSNREVTSLLEKWRRDHPPTCTPAEVEQFREAVKGASYIADNGESEVEIQIDSSRPEVNVLQGNGLTRGFYRIDYDGATRTCRMTFRFSGADEDKARRILPPGSGQEFEWIVDLTGFRTGEPFVLITGTGELKFTR
ncbi:MAG: hypothetical protein KDA25_05875, partial [Phycisphaerales bacterium]|nr:hypothetical protein [Phycisphaerales bacterium]